MLPDSGDGDAESTGTSPPPIDGGALQGNGSDPAADAGTSASDGDSQAPGDASGEADGPDSADGATDSAPCVACGDASCVDPTSDPNHCGGCGMKCPGQCTGGRCLVTLANAREPVQLAVDSRNVYFTAYDGTVDKVPVDGGATTVLATGVGYPWGIASDADVVYFGVPNFITNGVNAWVGSVPIDGGPTTTLASNTAGGRVLAILGGDLYWDSGGYETSTNAEIMSAPITGGAMNPFVPLKLGGFYSVPGMVPRDGLLFFSEDGVGIESQAPGATTPMQISSIAAGPLALDDANIYTFSTAGLVAISRTTGAVTTLVPGSQQEVTDSPTSIATDGVNAYWTNYYGIGQSTVLRVPASGGAVTTLASSQDDTSSIVLDSSSVYWIAGDLIQKMNKN